MAVITGRVVSRSGENRQNSEYRANEESSGYIKAAVIAPAAVKPSEALLPQSEESAPQKEIRFFTDPVRVRRDKLGAGAAVMLQLIISAGAALVLWLCLTFGGEELREALCDALRKFI